VSPKHEHIAKNGRFKRFILRFILFAFVLYASGCLWIYFNQESLLFHPEKLAKNHSFTFETPFKEFDLKTTDHESLNCLLFSGDSTHKRLVFFLHGNTGNLEDQEGPSAFYTSLGYDFCCFDYRGFGKSSGKITDEAQFFADARLVYNHLKKKYQEEDIVIIGYSVGTGTAALLASENHPKQLVLLAPYYSMIDMAAIRYPYVPSFLVSYPFETFKYIQQVKCPVSIFHGKEDNAIPYNSSKRLAGLMKKGDLFVPLENCDHNGISNQPKFQQKIQQLLQH